MYFASWVNAKRKLFCVDRSIRYFYPLNPSRYILTCVSIVCRALFTSSYVIVTLLYQHSFRGKYVKVYRITVKTLFSDHLQGTADIYVDEYVA